MYPDSPSPDSNTAPQRGSFDALRNFFRKLPVSIFIIVLLIHLAIGAWLLSARFALTQSPQDSPIFVSLLGDLNQDNQDDETHKQSSSEATSQLRQEPESPPPLSQAAMPPAAETQVDISLEQQRVDHPAQSVRQDKPAKAPQIVPVVPERPQTPSKSVEGAASLPSGAGASLAGAKPSTGPSSAQSGPKFVSHLDYLGSPPSPVYPSRAKSRGQEGRVVVRALVDSSGQLRNVSLLKSSGFNLLDQAALDAVSKTKFKPYSENGVSLDRLADIPIDFVLKD